MTSPNVRRALPMWRESEVQRSLRGSASARYHTAHRELTEGSPRPGGNRGLAACAADAGVCFSDGHDVPCCNPYADPRGWTIEVKCYEKVEGWNICRKAGTCKANG